MNTQRNNRRSRNASRSIRQGITVTEAVVGMTIMVVVVSTMSQLYVKSRRLMRQTRHQQLVLDELTMLAEHALSTESTPSDVPPLSKAVRRALPGAILDREIRPDGDFRRVTWTIRWTVTADTNAQHAPSRSMSIWLPTTGQSP